MEKNQMKKKKLSTKTIAMLAMMIAIALVFSYVETLIPINFGIPGVKLGLANLAIVAVLYIMGGKQALFVSVVRIVLSGFLFANLSIFRILENFLRKNFLSKCNFDIAIFNNNFSSKFISKFY